MAAEPGSSDSEGELDSAGRQPARTHGRVLDWVRTRVPRFARWIVLLFIASLFIPALTKQWNDRKQELQVKESLSTDISKVSADAVYGAYFAVKRQRGAQLEAARSNVLEEWFRDRAAVDPRFRVYFSNSDAAGHWSPGFREAVLRYVLMACCDSDDRVGHLRKLRAYLHNPRPPDHLRDAWSVLACGPDEPCAQKGLYDDDRYAAAYLWLANKVLAQRRVLLGQLLDANGTGFSTGWRDFVTDLNPLG